MTAIRNTKLCSNETVHAVRDCIQEIESCYPSFLSGERSAKHMAVALCRLLDPKGSFISAESRNDGRVIAVKIAHKPLKHPPVQNPRLFDLMYFAAMLLLNLAGGRFRFEADEIGGKLYFWLRYESPNDKGPGKRINVARIIKNTEPGEETPFAEDHHSYCWANLTTASATHRPRHAVHGRDDAIDLALDLYRRNPPEGLEMSPEDFEALIRHTFRVADRLQAWPVDKYSWLEGYKLSDGKPLGKATRRDLLKEAQILSDRAAVFRAKAEELGT